MKIKVIKYDGTEMTFETSSFEFRTNQVTNWIKIKLEKDETLCIHDVCVIKTIND